MPKRFQACTAKQPRKSLMSCCLNTVGDGKKCTGCAKCTQKTSKGTSCGNTTCMDPYLCHVHLPKRLGVKLIDTEHGKGLQATRDFLQGNMIAPMGGQITEGKWPDMLQTIHDFEEIERRDEGDGFYEEANAEDVRLLWSKSEVTEDDKESLRRAVVHDNYIYFVSKSDWKKFLKEATTKAQKILKGRSKEYVKDTVLNMIDTPLEEELGSKFQPSQFEARAEMIERLSPYGYKIMYYGDEYDFWRRDGPSGYIPLSELANRKFNYTEDEVKPTERMLVRALMAGNRVYLIKPKEWKKFKKDAKEIAKKTVLKNKTPEEIEEIINNLLASKYQLSLSKYFQPAQFEAYIEYLDDEPEMVEYDATCHRRIGSYANDPAIVTNDGIVDSRLEKANARISQVAPLPLSEKSSGAWLIAKKPIKKGEEILVSYGDEYWESKDIVYKLQNVPVSKLKRTDKNVGYGSMALVNDSRDEKTGKVKIPKCRLRKV